MVARMLAVGLLTRTLLNRNSPRLCLRATLPALALACGLITTPAAAQAPVDRTFTDELYPILEAAQCALCHNDNGIASRTRLRFPEDGASTAAVTSFGLSLGQFVDRNTPEQSLLFRKPTNRLDHTGGERIRQGSAEERTLRAWIGHLAKLPGDRVDAAQQQRDELSRKPIAEIQIRRLTHEQYNNTVRDLLGDETRPADAFPKEDFVHGFTNQAEGQNIAPLLAEAYNRAAETMARIAFQTGDYRGLVPCRPASADDASCRAHFIRTFGRKAFRRPLTDNEFARYEALFRREAERADDLLAGARITVEAMLQSPKFLFYARPSFGKADPYQTAARLSYFLWNTMPDDALLDAAGNGALATPDGIEQAARRMLRDSRAREAMHGFLAQWMRFDRLESAVRDRRIYPEFSAELVGSMLEETRRLFDDVARADRNFMDVFRSDYSFLSTSLAQLYGVPAPAGEFDRAEFPPETERAGLLGQATFLAVTSKPADTSPTERGKFVREHFLCQVVPPPPAGTDTTLPPLTDEKPLAARDRLQIHLSNEACAACHRLIDPIGFGFEKFDAIGRFRETQKLTIFPTQDEQRRKVKTKPTEYSLAIDATGYVQGLNGVEFSSPKDLGRILADDPTCQRCVVKQLFRYALGRPEAEADRPSIDRAVECFETSRFRFEELIISIATSDSFLGGPS